MLRLLKRMVKSQLFFGLVCLVLVLIMNTIVFAVKMHQNFFRIELFDNNTLQGPIMDILLFAPEIVILAMGMTLVASVSAGADISVGSVMVLSAAVGIRVVGWNQPARMKAVYEYDAPLILFFVLCLVIGALCGAWNGFLVSKLKVQPMVATLILLIAARAGSKVVMGNAQVPVFVDNFKWAGNYIFGEGNKAIIPIPTQIFIAAAVVALTWLVLRYTALGKDIQSVGVNARASRIMGLKPTRIIWFVFIFAGVCSGIAGLIAASRLAYIDSRFTGNLIELDVILAVALGGNSLAGGKFSLMGSVIGALTIQSLKTGLITIGVGRQTLPFYQAIVVVIIVVLQSTELRPMVKRATTRLRRSAPAKKVEVLS